MRVSEAGWLGPRGGVDMMVAMNPQTWDADVAEIEPGGYLFYDISRARCRRQSSATTSRDRHAAHRDHNAAYTTRASASCSRTSSTSALSVLLGHRPTVIEKLFGEQYKGKERCSRQRATALHLGRDFARKHLAPARHPRRSADNVGDRIFVDGNSAAGWAASTAAPRSAPGIRSRRRRRWPRRSEILRQVRVAPHPAEPYAIVQAEDELASIGMVVGAGWNGARAFTATSGPAFR